MWLLHIFNNKVLVKMMQDESLLLMTVAVLLWNWALSSICWQGWSSLLSVGVRSFWRAFSPLKKKKKSHFPSGGPAFLCRLWYLLQRVCVCVCVCLCAKALQLCLFATPWTVAHQTPLSMGFSRQETQGVGCRFLFQGSFLTCGSNPHLLHLPV